MTNVTELQNRSLPGIAPTLGQSAALAILWEATAPKPGNVHRGADFADMKYDDIVSGGIAISPVIDGADRATVGHLVLNSVQATRRMVGTNTNLGTILLLAPLAKAGHVPAETPDPLTHWRRAVAEVLAALTADDAALVYEAINLAQPGGLGDAPTHDVSASPPTDLMAAMRTAAEWDLVAAQYANNFEQVFTFVPRLLQRLESLPRNDAIVRVYLELMAEFPDSLIGRKLGNAVAKESSDRAAHVLSQVDSPRDYHQALADFDFWLRSDGNRRNPGTSADLIAAGLFCVIVLHGCNGLATVFSETCRKQL